MDADPAVYFRERFIRACLWDDNLVELVGRHDCVICVDVLEHIPPEHVDDVLENIMATADHGFLVPACFGHSHKAKGDPLELHLTVREPSWWRTIIRRHLPKGRKASARADDGGKYLVATY